MKLDMAKALPFFFRDWARTEMPGWTIEADVNADFTRVLVYRGHGREIEYGTVVVTGMQLASADGAAVVIDLVAAAAKEAKRLADHRSWLAGRINGIVLGTAGTWQKLGVAHAC